MAIPKSKCIKDNRGFIGIRNYIRRFQHRYAELTAPLVELNREYFVKETACEKAFGPAQREAFAHAKRALNAAPVLKFPDITLEFIIHTDASKAEVGAFLTHARAEVAPILTLTPSRVTVTSFQNANVTTSNQW